jgi:molybdopterin-binding protein
MSTEPYNRLRGIVRSVTQTGGIVHVVLEGADGELFTTLLTSAAADRLALDSGDELEATIQVAEVAANGRRAQPVVRTHTAVRDVYGDTGVDSTAI